MASTSIDNNWKKFLLTALGVVAAGLVGYYIIKGFKSQDEKKSENKAVNYSGETNDEESEKENSEDLVSIDEEQDKKRKEEAREKIVQRKSTGYDRRSVPRYEGAEHGFEDEDEDEESVDLDEKDANNPQ